MTDNIGERIQLVRKSTGLSQVKFAESLELSQGFLSNLEKGRYQPTPEILIRITSKYRINANWLLVGEGEMTLPRAENPIERAERVTEGKVEFRFKGKVNGQETGFDSKTNHAETMIIVDEQHRAMVDLMETAPGRETELLALVRGYLAGRKAGK